MATKKERLKNTRESLNHRRKEALQAKPTSSQLNYSSLTSEQIKSMFGAREVPKKVQRKLNKKGGIKKRFQRKRTTAVVQRKIGPLSKPIHTILATPKWFQTEGEIDVSIIIPLYKSKEVFKSQLKSWTFDEDGLTKEIIYVDDNCPNKTHEIIIQEWEKRRRDIKNGVGKIVIHDANGGFGVACNRGAEVAEGKYLIFLNADTTVSYNWIKPIVDALKNEEIGIVGNMQLGNNAKIDSAGSEWSWQTKSFRHIGKNIYKGKELPKSYTLENAPKDLLKSDEREMVTGCCFGIRKNLFADLDGFDSRYRIGYWEDADLCMRIKAEGYKIWYVPDSRIHHKVGHSNAGGHPAVRANRDIFKERWLDTGRIDYLVNATRDGYKNRTIKNSTKGTIIGCVIACNEEEFLKLSVDSIAPIVDDWIFVIGGNNYALRAKMCDERGYPQDNTLEIARQCAREYGGKVIEPPGRPWKDKIEMRNAYAEHLKHGQWMFMLDGDEVYKENQLWRIVELMDKYKCMIFQFWVFWNNMQTIGAGQWERYPQERIVQWQDGFGYRNGNHLHVSMKNGELARHHLPTFTGNERMFYHYSWVRPINKIRQKLAYYSYQSGNTQALSYVDDVFLKWRSDPESVEGNTHPMKGGNTAQFPGVHPHNVQKAIEQGKFNF